MANPQHIRWLLEGIANWNARRDNNDFRPDLSGEYYRRDFDDARIGNFTGLIPLFGVNLSDANLHKASFFGFDLSRSNFSGADLSEIDIRESLFIGANFKNATFSGGELHYSDFQHAKLENAKFHSTERYRGLGSKPEYTIVDLSVVKNLSQTQLDTAKGDTAVKLPMGLVHPKHWGPPPWETDPSDMLPKEEPDNSPEGARSWRPTSQKNINSTKQLLVFGKPALLLSTANLVHELEKFKTAIEQSNSLDQDFKDSAAAFFINHFALIDNMIAAIPPEQSDVTDDDAISVNTEFKGFWKSTEEGFSSLFNRDRLGGMVAPTSVVLTSAAIGSFFGAPLAGVAFGAWFTGKSSADKLAQKVFETPKD